MSNQQRRYEKLHNFQHQKQRLAELELVSVNQRLRQAMAQLESLRREFEQASHRYLQLLVDNPQSAYPQHDALVELGRRIESASQQVQLLQIEWRQASDHTIVETQKAESLNLLKTADEQRRYLERERRQTIETNERLVARSPDQIGEIENA